MFRNIFRREKRYLVSYRFTYGKNRDINFGEFTFSTSDKIDYNFIKEVRNKIEDQLEKEYNIDTPDVIILNIVCLTDL